MHSAAQQCLSGTFLTWLDGGAVKASRCAVGSSSSVLPATDSRILRVTLDLLVQEPAAACKLQLAARLEVLSACR